MTSKQKTAIAALIVSALVAVSAMLAPGVKCEPDPQLIEDALGGESSSTSAPDLGDGSSGSDSSGSSGT